MGNAMPDATVEEPENRASRRADLALALEHHRAGRLREAAHIYGQLCAADRRDPDVLFLMGVLCCDLGAFEPACRFLKQALGLAPTHARARGQLAVALDSLGDLQAAAGELIEAQRYFEQARTWMPENARTLRSLGRVALLRGDSARAEIFLARSLVHQQDHAEALNWLGLARLQLKKFVAAEDPLRQAVRLQPLLHQARNNLGLALHWQGRLAEAEACLEELLAIDPTHERARINLANTLRVRGAHERARQELEAVIATHPEAADALNNLGAVFQDLARPDQALATLTRALELAPDVPEIRWNLALTQLQLGDFKSGWRNFETRWQGCASLQGVYPMPLDRAWRGEALGGKRLLLWAEQGFGDTLQFIRFARDVALQGAVVDVLVPPELAVLVRNVVGVDAVFVHGESLPRYDYHCPLMSLPHHLDIAPTVQALHGATPYLSVTAQRVADWRRRLDSLPGLKVGLAWAGRARPYSAELMAVDGRRNLPLEQWGPILTVAGCSFFSLQKGPSPSAPDLANLGVSIQDFSAEWSDFADTAGFLANLDLVISIDSAVAHLAGGLGKPVWLLNRFDSCWRWMLGRSDSPWYASLRQFRQPQPGAWEPVVQAVAAALTAAVESRQC